MRNKSNITLQQAAKWIKDGNIKYTVTDGKPDPFKEESKPKKSKYKNTRVEYDGIKFQSIKECNRYKELLFALKKGLIGQLRLQVDYELNEGGTHSIVYRADFVYINAETGQIIVEDCKGFRTKVYEKKRELMLKVHKIKIKET